MADSPYSKYKNIDAMSVPTRIKSLEATCVEALKSGWHPTRMADLIEYSIEEEQYELTQAIIGATEKFQKNPQLSLFLFDVPDSVKTPLKD